MTMSRMPMLVSALLFLVSLGLAWCGPVPALAAAPEQVDQADPRQAGSAAIAQMTIRARMIEAVPESKWVRLNQNWLRINSL